MSEPPVVTRDVWRTARRVLLAREEEATRVLAEVSAARRALPMVEVDKEYVLEGPDGKVRLPELFEGRGQLIVYHFMFDPVWDAGCKFCSYLVDSVGDRSHLHARDTTLVLVSRTPIAKIEAFRSRMAWTVPWYSAYGSDFNYDFHVTQDEAVAPVEYGFQDKEALLRGGEEWRTRGEQSGLSVFVRRADVVYHTYSAWGDDTDLLIGTDNYLDLTPQGRPSPGEKGKWLRHHDRYEP
ncbi:DUF899 domain-containing protein [Streptomyces sp. CRN 30]|uniref:DUF899 domain-containing protein n=1 Tax=Streptomyces sp. CRN 30 TaxID=3075613 RepID=UPI002A7EFF7E|nr:DUF899 domain-containing protein [Streptomyces sp. CRN 30]